jgi:hypothetical protein
MANITPAKNAPGKQIIPNFTSIGLTGLNRYAGFVYEEYEPFLRWPQCGKVYQEMADSDPTIGAVLYLAEMLIRGTSWSVDAASQKPADIKAADFLQTCMDDMEMSWANTICEILSMLTYGFSFHEIVYKVRRGPRETSPKFKSKYDDGRIGWRGLPIRAQNSLWQWDFDDETGDVVAFEQMAPPKFNLITIPMSKGLLFRTRISRDNPEGKSLLRNAYRPWYFKKHLEEIEGIGVERDLAGLPVMTAPDGLDLWDDTNPDMVKLKNNAEALVASIRKDSEAGILLPHGWTLDLLTSKSTRQAVSTSDIINRYDNRIAITMLSDIVLIGNGNAGSFALADTKQSMLAAALQSQVQNIADVFNAKAVPDLFSYNYFPGITDFPRIKPGQIQTPSLKELALVLRAMNVNIAGDQEVMNYLRHLLGMPDLDKKEFEDIYKPQAPSVTDPNNAGVNDTNTDGPGTEQNPKVGGVKPDGKTTNFGDTTDNTLEQSDMSYTGGE